MRWGILLWALPVCNAFMSSSRKLELREATRALWKHAYSSYQMVAFPEDELLPLSCKPQGHDHAHPDNVAVNDIMGDYALTMVDSMDTFAVMGDHAGFEGAVRDTIQLVDFDLDSRVQVFEVTIRMLGGLLSSHLLATSPERGFALPWYSGQLLALAQDLGRRLLPAFNTPSGIPYPRVHLQRGVLPGDTAETCTAGAGSLLLEFGTLSRLTGDPIYERLAKKAFFALWNRRSELDLVGNTVNANDGNWIHPVRYAAKSYVMFGEDEWWRVWDQAYAAIMRHIRAPDGFWYRGANADSGVLATVIVDSLSAFFPGVQVLVGELDSAIKAHSVYAWQWKRYGGLPEMFDINRRMAVSLGYPLRPEFIESNLFLYRATQDEFYLEMAETILHDLTNRTRVPCGMASVIDLSTGALEDKQPSFLTSETLKYLYLTFDERNPFNRDDSNMVYSTEGHMLHVDVTPVPGRRRRTHRGEAPWCPAYDPAASSQAQHPLSLSVARRTDFEYSRFLVGYEVTDEAKEIREGRWSEYGFCDVPSPEHYQVEILFASSRETEDTAPSLTKVVQLEDGRILINHILGLKFALTRTWPGGDGYVVSRVGPYRVASGGVVTISDPVVLASIPQDRIQPVLLHFAFSSPSGVTSLKANALSASFGPTLSSLSLPIGVFGLIEEAFPLAPPPYDYGCDNSREGQFAGHVVVFRRGHCSFKHKARVAKLGGARAVIVINTANEGEIVPSADGDDSSTYHELVPLVIVANVTGVALENLSKEASLGARVNLAYDDAPDRVPTPVILGGYTVLNVILLRPKP